MSNFVYTLDEMENRFLSNLHNVFILVDMLIDLDDLIQNANDETNLGASVLKHQLDNAKCKTDAWKQHVPKSKNGERHQTMINKDVLRHLMSIDSKSADVAKTFNAGSNLVARFIKHDGLADVLSEPEDDNAILKILREVHEFHKIIGYYCAVGHPRKKGMKVNQVRLRSILKILKTRN